VYRFWSRFAFAALMGAVAFVVTMFVPSIAQAAVSPSSAPLCDFRGASIVVAVPDQLASVEVTATEAPANANVAALCDTRGATMIAPAPQLQSESTYLMLTPGTDDLSTMLEHAVIPGHPSDNTVSFEISFPDPSMISAVPFVAPASEIARIACPTAHERAHDGVKSSLDRPPQA